jgi:hypothetical protein
MKSVRANFCASFLLFVCSLTMVGQQSTTMATSAVVPQLVNFSGVLTDLNGKPLNNITGMTFLLYKEEQGGAPLWIETQNVQPNKTGHYTVMLGATTSTGLPADIFVGGEARWLAVQPQGQTEQPRVMLLSVPYALKAVDAQTVGGLPPSAFVLAAPPSANAATTGNDAGVASVSPATTSDVTTTGGTVDAIPLFFTATSIQNSLLTQTGTTTVNVGGKLNLPTTGAATAIAGKNSQPQDFVASSYSSSTKAAVNQTFQWQAEPAANDTTAPSGTLNLLYGLGTAPPTETGLKVSNRGVFTFATGQTFPGTGDGSVTSVATGLGLKGGPITKTGTLTIDTTKVPLLAANNSFTGNQTVNGNLSASGTVTGGTVSAGTVSSTSGYYLGGQLFDYGNLSDYNVFLGYSGNTANTGSSNTAVGVLALVSNTSGSQNTASGYSALYSNTTGHENAASGFGALQFNTTGGLNTGTGYVAGSTVDASNVAGFYNTFLGAYSEMSTGTLHNATAIGANAEVAASNAMVLGSINGANGATASTNVGIGTTAPAYLLHIGNTGGATYNNFLRVEGPTASGTGGMAASFGGYGNFQIDSVGYPGGRFYVAENGNAPLVGIGCSTGCITSNVLAIGIGLGPAIADGWATWSSRRWKTNIHTLHSALAKVEQLRGVSYDLKASGKHEVGVIAEEVGAVVPEIVSWDKNGKDANGVDYSRLTALLIEAIKEQQREFQHQQAVLRTQAAVIRNLKSELRATRQTLQKVKAQVTAAQPTLVATK